MLLHLRTALARLILKQVSLMKEQNKFLVLADSFWWDVSLCYTKEPLVEDSEDEWRVCRVIKEGKIRRDEHLKSKFQANKFLNSRLISCVEKQIPI